MYNERTKEKYVLRKEKS